MKRRIAQNACWLSGILVFAVLLGNDQILAGQPQQMEPPLLLRSSPAALTDEQVAQFLAQHEFYERDRHPASDLPNTYTKVTIAGDVVVYDAAYHLFWASGLVVRAAFDNAGEVVSTLHYAGSQDWRVPTLEELISVLTPPQGNWYYDKAFTEFLYDCTWSADAVEQSGSDSGWAVCFDTGIVTKIAITGYQSLLLVRSADKPPIDGKTGASIRGLSQDW
jgi:hypothetical protein